MTNATPSVSLRDLARGALTTVTELRHIHPGLVRLLPLRPTSRQSIGRMLEYWAAQAPERIALRFENRRWTYAEFNAWTNRLAASFAARGIQSGDTVALLMENRPELLACVAATVKLGAVAAMLNHNQRGEVLAHSIRLVSPKVIVIGAECLDAIATTPYSPQTPSGLSYFLQPSDAPSALPLGYIDLEADTALRSPRNPRSTAKVTASQPCYYIFTSGTTGLPKASVMTHYRWLGALLGIGGLTLRLRPDDVFYCCLPLYHNNALTVSWASVLAAGATLALDRKFSASQFWYRLRHYEATAFCYIGELLRYLLNQPATPGDGHHSVRLIVGNGLRPELWQAFEQRFGISRICEFYGASESNIGFINLFGIRQTAGFTPLPYAIVEFDAEREEPVRDGRGFMRRVGAGGVGLLISEVTKRQPFDGYTDASANEKKLLRDVFKKGDCWFNSGDLVRDQGWHHIQFVDRVGDTFRWKGENVATSEIEGVLAREPDLDHAVVYGVSVAGHDGRAGMAAVSLRHGAVFDGLGLSQRLHAQLPAYAVPLFIRIRPEQETTGTFKYRKVELKQAGFDPAQIEEPLYVLADKGKGYEPLTAELFARISRGEVRV